MGTMVPPYFPTLPMSPLRSEPGRTRWVPCGRARLPTRRARHGLPRFGCWFYIGSAEPRTGSGTAAVTASAAYAHPGRPGEAPADRLHARQAEHLGERGRDLELPAGPERAAVDDGREHRLPADTRRRSSPRRAAPDGRRRASSGSSSVPQPDGCARQRPGCARPRPPCTSRSRRRPPAAGTARTREARRRSRAAIDERDHDAEHRRCERARAAAARGPGSRRRSGRGTTRGRSRRTPRRGRRRYRRTRAGRGGASEQLLVRGPDHGARDLRARGFWRSKTFQRRRSTTGGAIGTAAAPADAERRSGGGGGGGDGPARSGPAGARVRAAGPRAPRLDGSGRAGRNRRRRGPRRSGTGARGRARGGGGAASAMAPQRPRPRRLGAPPPDAATCGWARSRAAAQGRRPWARSRLGPGR